jgi:hypothetical protein
MYRFTLNARRSALDAEPCASKNQDFGLLISR